ncbi:hypothetical protein THAOC_34198, partial [Thalassiosira oceanica]
AAQVAWAWAELDNKGEGAVAERKVERSGQHGGGDDVAPQTTTPSPSSPASARRTCHLDGRVEADEPSTNSNGDMAVDPYALRRASSLEMMLYVPTRACGEDRPTYVRKPSRSALPVRRAFLRRRRRGGREV